ncbi:hypothetical protein GPALN_006639 [Globodera pallida]|nr:hypothetical protein GPALN_006639 [Globodera pallida]
MALLRNVQMASGNLLDARERMSNCFGESVADLERKKAIGADDNESDENECKVPLAEEEPISLFLRLNTALPMLSDIFRFHLVRVDFKGTTRAKPQCTLFKKDGYLCNFKSETVDGLHVHQSGMHTRAARGTTHNCEYSNFGTFDEFVLGRHARHIHHRSISPLPNRGVLTEDWRIGYATGLQVDDPRILRNCKGSRGAFRLEKIPKQHFFENSSVELRLYPNDLPRTGTSGSLDATVAMVSLALEVATPFHIAMTGEIHHNGRIGGIGGVTHKLFAARHDKKNHRSCPK